MTRILFLSSNFQCNDCGKTTTRRQEIDWHATWKTGITKAPDGWTTRVLVDEYLHYCADCSPNNTHQIELPLEVQSV